MPDKIAEVRTKLSIDKVALIAFAMHHVDNKLNQLIKSGSWAVLKEKVMAECKVMVQKRRIKLKSVDSYSSDCAAYAASEPLWKWFVGGRKTSD